MYDVDNKLIAIEIFTICYQNTEEEREATDRILKGICLEILSQAFQDSYEEEEQQEIEYK